MSHLEDTGAAVSPHSGPLVPYAAAEGSVSQTSVKWITESTVSSQKHLLLGAGVCLQSGLGERKHFLIVVSMNTVCFCQNQKFAQIGILSLVDGRSRPRVSENGFPWRLALKDVVTK